MNIEELEDDIPQDFRRANGSPMVMIDGKNERYSRPSGWGKDLDDENALVNWKLDTAMYGVAMSKALAAKIVAVKPEDRAEKAKLREEAIQTGRGNEASDTGTALHAMSVRWEDPHDEFDPGDYGEDLKAYSAAMNELGLVSEMFEFQVVTTEYRTAGTCDRLYRTTRDLMLPDGSVLPAGSLVIGDLKTGKKLDFSLPGYSVQLALYARGELYDVTTDSVMPTPEINQDWALLVHLPVGKGICEMRWVDLGIGAWGAYLTQQVRLWRKNWRNGTFDAPIADPTMTADQIVEILKEEFPGTEVVDLHDAEWVDMMSPFAQQRIKTIGGHEKARTTLMQRWPVGVPTIKQGIEDPQDMTQVLHLLDAIEREFSLPFSGGDPRSQPGVYQDAITITNTPPQKEDSNE